MWIYFYAAHLLGDFMFQPDRCVNGRKERPILFLGKHVAIHIVLMAIASFIAMSMNNSFHLPVFLLSGQAILLISICHYLIDYGKMKLNDNLKGTGNQAFLFLLDQMLHFLTIWIAFHGLHISTRLLDNGAASFFRGWTTDEKIVATGCVFILATYGADRFLQIVLQDIMPNRELQEGIYRLSDEKMEVKIRHKNDGGQEVEITTVKTEQFFRDSPAKIGSIIGMLERMLIVIFMIMDMVQGLAFLAALKTLARFKQFEHKQFSEYYLIGTLSSAVIGILLGIVASQIW
ncbi:DUF3307 domain-containing protein [Parageobacillus sp. KH3-4]|uniref:DUF3307 domain-containing protein n=1 Tax=Parageobacillus sp. KH3-4 TaxID=2916802 RepID=UPI001FCAB4ED|nr:DUF3307 domain-containing protein [Parageobacillus sp. KH3-4]BDG47188.1 hypothetical protein PspKH34_17490 [Parageobacillus sp. KH3-4]